MPVAMPAPGATGAIAATRASWPETIFKDSAAAVDAGETVTLMAPLAAGQVLSPLYCARN
jgi:hypothetical protein